MITLGMDPHPGSYTVAALDCNGSLLGSIRVPNTSAGLEQLHHFASRFASRRWAIEGAGNRFVAQFVKELLAKGETIYPIAPSLTSQYRCRRGTKKNDQVDAANVARVYLLIRSFHPSSIQTGSGSCKSCHGRTDGCQNSSDRTAPLSPSSQHSPLYEQSSEQVIRTLVVQLNELEKQLRSIVRTLMLGLLGVARSRCDCGWDIAGGSGRSAAIPDCRSLCQLLRRGSRRKRKWPKHPHAGKSWWKSSSQLGAAHRCKWADYVWTTVAPGSSSRNKPIREKQNARPYDR